MIRKHSTASCSSVRIRRTPVAVVHAQHCQRRLLTKCNVRHEWACARRVGCRSSVEPTDGESWSEDDLMKMVEMQDIQIEEALGNAWKSMFEHDVEGLFNYVDRQYDEYAELHESIMAIPKEERESSGAVNDLLSMPAGMANDLIGMGSWRLKTLAHPAIQLMVARMEGQWREVLSDSLILYPTSKWKAKGWDFIDSIDPANEWNGYAYVDIPDPPKEDPSYPRLLIENRIYASSVFRKLHLEVAWRQDGLEVLHMVAYPRYDYDLPILSFDMVIANGKCTLAIIDACPVRADLRLPAYYTDVMERLQRTFLTDADNQRRIPEWGTKIFSSHCVCIRPESAEDLKGFVAYAAALHYAHLQLSALMQPVLPAERRGVLRLQDILAGHQRYVEQQLRNKKTSRVLEAALGSELTQQYMTQVMFDFSPDDEVPVVDRMAAKLYEYFAANPSLGFAEELSEELERQEHIMARQRADQTIEQLLTGEQVSPQAIESAMQVMFETDEVFRRQALALLPDLRQCSPELVGQVLAEELQDMGRLGSGEQSLTQ